MISNYAKFNLDQVPNRLKYGEYPAIIEINIHAEMKMTHSAIYSDGILFVNMMTSSNGNIFHRSPANLHPPPPPPPPPPPTPHPPTPVTTTNTNNTTNNTTNTTKASDTVLWCFLWFAPNKRLSQQSWAGDLRLHRAHYDVTVVIYAVSCLHGVTAEEVDRCGMFSVLILSMFW